MKYKVFLPIGIVLVVVGSIFAYSAITKEDKPDLSTAGSREIYYVGWHPQTGYTYGLYQYSTRNEQPQLIGRNLILLGVDDSHIYVGKASCDSVPEGYSKEVLKCPRVDDQVRIIDRESLKKVEVIPTSEFDEKYKLNSAVESEVLWNIKGGKNDNGYGSPYQDDVFMSKNGDENLLITLKQKALKNEPFCSAQIFVNGDEVHSFKKPLEDEVGFSACYHYYFGRTADEAFRISRYHQDGDILPPTEEVSVIDLENNTLVKDFYASKDHVWIYQPSK